MNKFNVVSSYYKKIQKKYPNWYWAIDLHNCIFKPDYKSNSSGGDYFPHAQKTLQTLSIDKEIILILYTSSNQKTVDHAIQRLKKDNIHFKYINENPEIQDSLADYSKKFYFDILIDDKAGFEGDTDWITLYEEYQKVKEIFP